MQPRLFVTRDDETLEGLLDSLTVQNAAAERLLVEGDLDDAVKVPPYIYAAYRASTDCTVRWVTLHLIEEFTRHAGHADILRESIDGATMYELMAAVEGWPETGQFKPWKPPTASDGGR